MTVTIPEIFPQGLVTQQQWQDSSIWLREDIDFERLKFEVELLVEQPGGDLVIACFGLASMVEDRAKIYTTLSFLKPQNTSG